MTKRKAITDGIWQPIESMPGNKLVLLCRKSTGCKYRLVIAAWRPTQSAYTGGYLDGLGIDASTVGAFSHWMPLPEPPK